MCWVIISIKSDKDLLQGVNKLDSLLKISMFQVLKIENHIQTLIKKRKNNTDYRTKSYDSV